VGMIVVIVHGLEVYMVLYSRKNRQSQWHFLSACKADIFHRNLNHNDGLLVGRISVALKINYIDAEI